MCANLVTAFMHRDIWPLLMIVAYLSQIQDPTTETAADHGTKLRMDGLRNVLHTGCFLVLWFIYPACCAKIFHFFVCDTMPDGDTRYLRVDYSISCDAPERAAFLLYAVLMGLLYPVGTPLLYYVILRCHKKAVDRLRVNQALRVQLLDKVRAATLGARGCNPRCAHAGARRGRLHLVARLGRQSLRAVGHLEEGARPAAHRYAAQAAQARVRGGPAC